MNTSNQFDLIKLSDDFIEIRNQALLDIQHRQLTSGAISMAIIILIIGGLALKESNFIVVLVWVVCALAMQAMRYKVIPHLNRPNEPGANRRLNYIVLMASFNGLVLASSYIFFSSFDEGARYIYTMIIVGVCMGFVVSSHGYMPIFLGFVVPQLFSLTMGWVSFPLPGESDWIHARAMVFVIFTVFLYNSCRNAFKAFEDNCILTAKLQTTLESETNANAAKTRFLAAASHDLRQPLHTISMLSAALSLRPLDTESAAIANRISEAMAELSAELDSLLDISKMDAGVTTVCVSQFSVNALIERLVKGYHSSATEKDLELSVNYNANSIIETDRILLERVLRNLLDNAVKYTDVGCITITVSDRDSMCVIQIEDTGIGIPEEEKQHVYEEFYQLQNPERDRRKGLGLGLSIVGRIVPLLNADLELVSTPGAGSAFVLSLPRVIESCAVKSSLYEEDLQGRINEAVALMFSDVHTLVVEDDREVRRSMRILLESAGSKVSEASSTLEAAEIASVSLPDIVLVDLRLPAGDSGYRTIKELRKLDPTIPVIIVSGELTTNDAEYVKIDNCEYFVKPVDMATLFEQMQQMLKSTLESRDKLRQSMRVTEY